MTKTELNLSRALANAIDLLVNDYGIDRSLLNYVLDPLTENEKQEFLDGLCLPDIDEDDDFDE